MNLLELFLQNPKITTDTRKLEPGGIFFALKGDNFDGNQYAEKAIEAGAKYAVIDNPDFKKDNRYILVEDVLKSLQDLSTQYRNTLTCKILVIAGSNGKTTTKELVSRVLESKYKIFSTKGNLNNHIGVPLSLLSIENDTDYAVIEIGANHLNENKFLCEISNPDFAIVTNCGKDHLEGFGGIEGVIAASKEVYDYLKSNKGKCFINGDDSLLLELAEGIEKIIYQQGEIDEKNVIAATIIEKFPFLKIKSKNLVVDSRLFGSFQIYNLLAAIAVGRHFQVNEEKIKEALESYNPSNNRSQLINWGTNSVLLDAYNANPSSMTEMIRDFSEAPESNKVAVLGDMFELGDESYLEHKNIVNQLNNSDISQVILIGNLFNDHSSISKAKHFNTTSEAKEWILSQEFQNKYILVKGSRGMALEKIFTT